MNELGTISAHAAKNIEGVAPGFLREGLLSAQKKTWDAFHKIRERLIPGMTEDEARKTALAVFAELGVTKHWHRPYTRFGAGTALTFFDPVQPDYRLREDDPVYLDLGPVWVDADSGLEYEGDVGDTYVLGENPAAQKCAETARALFNEAQERWRGGDLTGEGIYRLLKTRTEELGYLLTEKVEGHRLSDFPHFKYGKERLGQLTVKPGAFLWILEVHIRASGGEFGAFFEDLL